MKKQYLIVLIVLIVILGLGSCKNSTTETNAETDNNASLDVTNNESKYLAIDTINSKIKWKGFKPGGSHHGTLGIKSGELIIDNNTLKSGVFILNMNDIVCKDLTLDEGSDKLEAHLKGLDFFEVEKYPEGKFTITKVEELGEGAYSHRIYGDLELKGVLQNIHFDAKIIRNEKQYEATTESFTIDRTKWGVNYGSKNIFKELKDQFINDEIEIAISIMAAEKIQLLPTSK